MSRAWTLALRHCLHVAFGVAALLAVLGLTSRALPREALVELALNVAPVNVPIDDSDARAKAAAGIEGLVGVLLALAVAVGGFTSACWWADGRDPALSAVRGEERESPELALQRSDFAVAAGLAGLVLLLAWPRLGIALRWDELDNYRWHLQLGLGDLLTTNHAATNQLGYSVLAWFSMRIFGDVPWAVRLPSLVAGMLLPGVLYAALRRRVGLAGALAVALLACVWNDFRQAATLGRGYSLLVLGAVLHWEVFRALLRNPNPRLRWAWVLTFAWTATCHTWFLLAGVAECAWLVVLILGGARASWFDREERRVLQLRELFTLLEGGTILAALLQAGIFHKYFYMLTLTQEGVRAASPASWDMALPVLVGRSLVLEPSGPFGLAGGTALAVQAVLAVLAGVGLLAALPHLRTASSLREEVAHGVFAILVVTLVATVARPLYAYPRFMLFVLAPLLAPCAYGWQVLLSRLARWRAT